MNKHVERDRFDVDLTNCDREPIHIPGRIQPHGILLAVDLQSLQVVQWSANCFETIGITHSQLSGTPIESLIDAQSFEIVRRLVEADTKGLPSPLNCTFLKSQSQSRHLGNAHVFDDVLILEFERRVHAQDSLHSGIESAAVSISRYVQQATAALQACSTLPQLYHLLAQQIRFLSGFDRVMVYRFMPDLHGIVEGEALREGLEPYHGLHYPATDIPPQARRLYTLNPMRLIVDINADPVPLEPSYCPIHGRSLDLTYSVFRSVSPIHIEYLRNMGVAASMSISILSNGELWGLIACHHYQPREISLELRAACEMLGTMAGGYITARQLSNNLQMKLERQRSISQALQTITPEDSIYLGMAKASDALVHAMDADGLAVVLGDRVSLSGITPSKDAVKDLHESLLQSQVSAVWHTHDLSMNYPSMVSHSEKASGIISMRLGNASQDMLIFFRPEFVSEITWAGDPEKTATLAEDGIRLSPRKSFAQWKQTVHRQSRAWSQIDQELAGELHAGLMRLVAGRATELQRINEQLIQINADLDSFAYAASHDLKEPLRTIGQTVYFLERALGEDRAEEVDRRITTIQKTVVRMTGLLDGLLRVSRAGRGDLALENVDLAEVVREASELSLHSQLGDIQLAIDELPTVRADFMSLRDVFQNLLANASKYNINPAKIIHVGSILIEPSESVPTAAHGRTAFFVKDNGIGIARSQLEDIFQVFRRLHAQDEFGGGSGVGLAIVRRIVQRHGGVVWVSSKPGIGTTFFFTLGNGSDNE